MQMYTYEAERKSLRGSYKWAPEADEKPTARPWGRCCKTHTVCREVRTLRFEYGGSTGFVDYEEAATNPTPIEPWEAEQARRIQAN